MSRGRFITFEGGEGAGKSTQSHRLVAALGGIGIDTIRTREPGGSPGAEAIRDLLVRGAVDRWEPLSEALLHSAARHEHLARTVRPALDAGRWVVCDRFADSTMAYQGYGHRLGRPPVQALQALVVGDTMPDLTLILDLPAEDGLARAARSAGVEDRYERMGEAFHRRLRQGFLDIAAHEPRRCAVIDARPDVDSVWQAVRATVAERLGIAWP